MASGISESIKAFCVLSREGLQMLTYSHGMVGTTQRVAPRPDAYEITVKMKVELDEIEKVLDIQLFHSF